MGSGVRVPGFFFLRNPNPSDQAVACRPKKKKGRGTPQRHQEPWPRRGGIWINHWRPTAREDVQQHREDTCRAGGALHIPPSSALPAVHRTPNIYNHDYINPPSGLQPPQQKKPDPSVYTITFPLAPPHNHPSLPSPGPSLSPAQQVYVQQQEMPGGGWMDCRERGQAAGRWRAWER